MTGEPRGNAGGKADDFIKQLQGVGAYAKQCGKGYGQLDAYLKSLYTALDDLLEVPMEASEAEKIGKVHSNYKANLASANGEIAKYNTLEKLVQKVLSDPVGTQEEAARTISEIEKNYQAVIGGALAAYQLIDPQIDASGLIGGLYSKLAEYTKMDLNLKLSEGLGILRKYYVTDEMIAQIKSRAGKQRQHPEAHAKAA